MSADAGASNFTSAGQAFGSGLLSSLQNVGSTGALMSWQYGLNARSASKSWDRQKNLITRGPQYQMIGLREAGINPILAARGALGGNLTGARAPQAHGASATGMRPDPYILAELKRVESQSAAQMAFADHQKAQADNVRQRTELEGYTRNYKKLVNDLYGSDDGPELVERIEMLKASPSGITGALSLIEQMLRSRSGEVVESSPELEGIKRIVERQGKWALRKFYQVLSRLDAALHGVDYWEDVPEAASVEGTSAKDGRSNPR